MAEGEGVKRIRFEAPRPRFVTAHIDGLYDQWRDIVPLGVAAPAVAHTASASIAVALPGGIGSTVYVDLEPLDAYDQPMRDPDHRGILPRIELLALTRASADEITEEYNLFVSEPIAFTADPRETHPDHTTVMAGDRISARLRTDGADADLSWLTDAERDHAEGRVRSWRLELVDSLEAPTPGAESTGSGDVLGVLLHSGEFIWSVTDLAVPGRLFDFAWSRSHRSQTIYNGPLGRGWDSPYLARVQIWPDNSLVVYPGDGRRQIFPRRAVAVGGREYETPAGTTVDAATDATGSSLTGASGSQVQFNVQGDLVALVDKFGNRIRFLRDANGRLETILDTMGRVFTVHWDDQARIGAVRDFAGRTVTYAYDASGRIEQVTRFDAFSELYGYEDGAEAKHALASITNEAGELWLANGYELGKLTSQQWGGPDEDIAVLYETTSTTVTDRRGSERKYTHDASGRLTTLVELSSEDQPKTEFVYDDFGRLEKTTCPLQNVVEREYAVAAGNYDASAKGRGNVTKIRRIPDARGGNTEVTTLTYDADHRLIQRVGPRNEETTFVYGDKGELLEIRAPEGATTKYEYNDYGQRLKATSPEGLITEYAYRPETNPGGSAPTSPDTGLDAQKGGYLWTVTVDEAELALVTELTYDALGRVIEVTDPAGTLHKSEYEERGLVTREIRAASMTDAAYETRYEYDPRGLRTKTIYHHSGAKTPGDVTITDEYDDPLGFHTLRRIEGPELSAPVELEWTPDPVRNLHVATRANGTTETYTYTPRSQVERIDTTGGPHTLSVFRTFDQNGNLLSEQSPRAAAYDTVYHYDGHDRLTQTDTPRGYRIEREYFPGGLLAVARVVDLTDPLEAEVTVREQQWTYDDLGRIATFTNGPEPESTESYARDFATRTVTRTDRRNQTWTEVSYANGWLKTATDPLGNATSYTYHRLGGVATETRTDGGASAAAPITITTSYDGLGRRTQVEDPGDHVVRWTYDSRDNVKTAIDALGQVTTFSYDALDRLRETVGPNGESTFQTWDANGNLETYKDALDNVTTYGYDELDRKTSVEFPGLSPYTYTYDAHLLATEVTPRGYQFTYQYDEADRLIERQVHAAGVGLHDAPLATDTYRWDALDRLLEAENASATVTRTYDANDRVLTETVSAPGLPPLTRTLSRTFDVAGNLTSLSYPGGRVLTVAPDPLGRIDTITQGELGETTHVDYDYQGPDRLQTKTIAKGSGSPLTSTYSYDAERLLESVVRTTGAGAAPVVDRRYAWTARHELGESTNNLRRATRSVFDYDDAGRLTNASYVVPEDQPAPAAARATTFTLDAVRNIETTVDTIGGAYEKTIESVVTTGNRYSEHAGQPLGYDEEGSLREDAAGRILTFDWDNRLTEVETETSTVQYEYDALNRKVRRSEGGEDRFFFYDGWQLIEETDTFGDVTFEAVNGRVIDEPLKFWVDGAERRVIQDRMGSVIGITDDQGKVLEAAEYGAYGSYRLHGPPQLDNARFEDNTLILRFSDEIDATSALDESPPRLTPAVDGAWTQDASGRELIFTPDPDWPDLTEVTVEIAEEIRSVHGLELEQGEELRFTPSTQTEPSLFDQSPPEAIQVAQDPGGQLVVVFSEPIESDDLNLAFVLTESDVPTPAPYSAQTSSDRTTVLIDIAAEYTPGEDYTLELAAGRITDLAGQPAPSATWSWTASEDPLRIWDPEPRTVASTGNRFFFQGHPQDPTTGLVDFRNRWYDPELARWVSRDPSGYPDGPNQYASFVANPAMFGDPAGLAAGKVATGVVRRYAGRALQKKWNKKLYKRGLSELLRPHHIMPDTLSDQFGAFFSKVGFSTETAKNLVLLPTKEGRAAASILSAESRRRTLHNGGHLDSYMKTVATRVAALRRRYYRREIGAAAARSELKAIQAQIREGLEKGTIRLQDKDEYQRAVPLDKVLTVMGVVAVTATQADALVQESAERELLIREAIAERLAAETDFFWARFTLSGGGGSSSVASLLDWLNPAATALEFDVEWFATKQALEMSDGFVQRYVTENPDVVPYHLRGLQGTEALPGDPLLNSLPHLGR